MNDLEPGLDRFLEVIADRVAAKVEARLPAPTVGKRLLTVKEAAVYLGRSTASVQHMIASGRVPTVRADRRVFIDVRDLDIWIEQNKQPMAA